MQIVSRTGFLPAVQVTQLGPFQYVLSTIVKGTFELVNNEPVAIAEEQAFASGDVAYPDAKHEQAAPRYPSDFVPWKPSADLMLVGHCHAPNQSVRRCPAVFSVGARGYALEVIGDRTWPSEPFPSLPEPAPFQQIELRYENSFGGAAFESNPIGTGFQSTELGERSSPLPNVEDPHNLVQSPKTTPEPVGFGPLPIVWPQRSSKCGTLDQRWQQTRFPGFPNDFDWSFHNAAPSPLQSQGYLRGDEECSFENLRPDAPLFRTRLPGLRTRCFVNASRSPCDVRIDLDGRNAPTREDLFPANVLPHGESHHFYEVKMNLDTLWVDMDAQQLVLVWRGMTPIQSDDYSEIDHLFFLTEDLEESNDIDDYAKQFQQELEKAETVAGMVSQLPGGISKKLPALPDVDTEMARVEQHMADVVAEVVDVENVNRSMTSTLGDAAPQLSQLSGTGIAAQLAAFDAFTDAVTAAAEKLVDVKRAHQRQYSDTPRSDNAEVAHDFSEQQAQANLEKLVQSEGIDEQFREANTTIKDMAVDVYRSGFNLSALGIDLSRFLLGLRGVGVDTEKLESDLGCKFDDDPLTREKFLQRLSAGQSFAGETLIDLDLSEVDLRNTDFRDAILVRVQLAGADLSGADFSRAVLSQVDLTGSSLVATKLPDSNLCGITLTQANLTGAVLDGALCGNASINQAVLDGLSGRDADFSGSDFSGSRLLRCSLSKADFSNCQLKATSFRQSDLREAAFDEARGEQADFTAADLTKARCSRDCRLPAAVFHQARMSESNWSNADLTGADFSYAQLNESFFVSANLERANFTAACLRRGRLSKAQLQDAKLTHADLLQTAFDKSDLTRANLSGASAYNADFCEAILDNASLDGANLQMTILSSM